MKKKYLNLILHITIWIVYIFFNYFLAYLQGQENVFLVDYLTKYLLVVQVFYINVYYLLPALTSKKRIPHFIIAQLLMAGLHFVLFWAAYKYVLPALFHFPPMPYTWEKVLPRAFWWYCSFFLYAFGFWYAKQAIQKQKTINELQNKNFVMEFNFLKSQINSHFLHNTLNTLFAQALPYSEELAGNIIKLSNMMRYSLENIDRADGQVQLKSELAHLQNFIDIHQFRFSNKLQIDYHVTGDANNHMVPPLSLITVIENAFKYGYLKNADHPLKIKIDLTPGKLYFFCRNQKKKTLIETSHGIGIQNVRKRLEYAFKGRYEMHIQNEKEYYTFELTIKD